MFESPEADKYRNASINELVAMWNALQSLDMVSHPHAAYARALCKSVRLLETCQKECIVAKALAMEKINVIEEHMNKELFSRIERFEAQLNEATESLMDISLSSHAGQGWCYEPHGTRPCSCHIQDARDALRKIAAMEEDNA